MNTDSSPSTQAPSLRISGELTIVRAHELKSLLLDAPAPLEVDLSQVSEIDTAGVQLLMLAKATAQGAQRELRLVAHSAAVLEVFELLNLAAFFNDPLIMESRGSGAGQSAGVRGEAFP